MTRSQTRRVLDLLRSQGEEGVTALDALQIVGSFRLAARILELRDEGHDIVTRWETTPTGKRCARYVLLAPKTLWLAL
jgi:hypothetical protein